MHTIYTLQDMDDVDFLLSMSMTEFGSCMFQLLSTLIFLAVIQPWILVGIAPLAVIYWVIQRFYRRSYRRSYRDRSNQYAHPSRPRCMEKPAGHPRRGQPADGQSLPAWISAWK